MILRGPFDIIFGSDDDKKLLRRVNSILLRMYVGKNQIEEDFEFIRHMEVVGPVDEVHTSLRYDFLRWIIDEEDGRDHTQEHRTMKLKRKHPGIG